MMRTGQKAILQGSYWRFGTPVPMLLKMAEFPPAEAHRRSHNTFEAPRFPLRTAGKQQVPPAPHLTMRTIRLPDQDCSSVRDCFQLLFFRSWSLRPWNLRLARAAIPVPPPAASREE